ncbi:MAG: adenosine kinase [Marinagarivorans sp.]|nr:adenosine kinase [Marinagarivorans sp.]
MINYGIYGIGAALVDTEIEVNNHELSAINIEKGVMTLVDQARQQALIEYFHQQVKHSRQVCGGSAANSIIAAQYFGSPTFFSCQIAKDSFGKTFASELTKAGIDTQALRDAKEGVTGKCLVMITPDAERTMNTHLGISETFSIANIDTTALQSSKFVYIEGYLVTSTTGKPAAIFTRKQAQAKGVKVALSLSDPAMATYFRDGIKEIIGEKIDWIFCNHAEALAFTEQATIEEAAMTLGHYSRNFVITCGKEPTWVFDGNKIQYIHTQAVKAIDTNGAGDMFAGAFLAALDQGKSAADAAAFANRAAAVVVSQFGPRLSAEQYRELKAYM